MPYIICVNRPGYLPEDGPYAVATVEEMRQDARNLVEDAAQEPGWSGEWKAAREDARNLPESGGVVGPLPDGYVIDVQPKTWDELADLAGCLGPDDPGASGGLSRDDARANIIDAYNQH